MARVALAALLAVLLLASAAPAMAQTRSRPRIIWDVPSDKVIRIARVARGHTVTVDVPFHTTGDLMSPEVTVWTRGVRARVVAAPRGSIEAFTAQKIVVAITAPPGIVAGNHAITFQVADRPTNARDLFRTTVTVEDEAPTPVPPTATPIPTATPSPTPTPRPVERGPLAGRWGVVRPARASSVARPPAARPTAEQPVRRRIGFVPPP